VLVVDDEADARELIAFILNDVGADVTVSASAKEALAILARSKFDILSERYWDASDGRIYADA